MAAGSEPDLIAENVALRAENERLKADNLDLINSLEGEGYRLERLHEQIGHYQQGEEIAADRIAQLEAALRKCQWGGYRMHRPSGTAMLTCPVCGALNERGKHNYGCEVAAALKGDAE